MVLSNVDWNNHISEDNNNSIKKDKRCTQSRDHVKCMFFYSIYFRLFLVILGILYNFVNVSV